MSELENLYREVVLDHARRPHGFGLSAVAAGAASARSHQLNPTCGDEVTVQVAVGADGTIDGFSWEGHGCAISQSSASMLADLAPGLTAAELTERIGAFREMMHARGEIEGDEELLGDAAVFSSAAKYVARVKCAMLSWVAVEDALRQLG